MTAQLRELAERWKAESHRGDYRRAVHACADELLSILDAEGDGGATSPAAKVIRTENGSCYIEWAAGADMLDYVGANLYTQPARSDGVSDEACITKAQKIVRDVWETWYPGNEWTPVSGMHDLLCQMGNSLLGVPEFTNAVDSRLQAQNAIDAAMQGESNV